MIQNYEGRTLKVNARYIIYPGSGLLLAANFDAIKNPVEADKII